MKDSRKTATELHRKEGSMEGFRRYGHTATTLAQAAGRAAARMGALNMLTRPRVKLAIIERAVFSGAPE